MKIFFVLFFVSLPAFAFSGAKTIQNHDASARDWANVCYGASQQSPDPCAQISDNADLANLCYGASQRSPDPCAQIKDNAILANVCYGAAQESPCDGVHRSRYLPSLWVLRSKSSLRLPLKSLFPRPCQAAGGVDITTFDVGDSELPLVWE